MTSSFRLFLILLAGIFTASAWAHKASDAYILLKQPAAQAPIQIQFAVALRDLDRVFDTLDANNDRAVSFGEVKAALPGIESWAANGVKLRCGATELSLPYRFEALEQRSDGVFVRLAATSRQPCDTQAQVSLRYTLMQGVDADHRVVMSFQLKHSGDPSDMQGSAALQPSEEWHAIALSASSNGQDKSASRLATLGSFIVLGMEHIGSGADHIAFVICLVLGLALIHRREWKALLIAVTAFTLGHSITLISATLGWVGSPSWVEPVIALSIAIAATVNLCKHSRPWLKSIWLSAALTATFGLVHGLGFSGAMTEAQVPDGSLLWALAGFNIGVELGQLLIITAWSLVYWAIHRWAGYQRWVVQGGSILLISLGLYWFFERLGWLG
jgi:hypothetical protein